MYKIFFDERTFIITDNRCEIPTQTNIAFIEVNNRVEMDKAIGYFDNSPQIQTLYVYSPDLEKAIKWFTKSFNLIEAAGGLVQKDDKYLLIYRFNHWDLPKGKCEKGETIQQTAVREVEEECGIHFIELQAHIINTYHTYAINNQRYFKKTYWFKMTYNGNETLKPQSEEDIASAEWLNLGEIKEVKPLMYHSVAEVFVNAGITI